MKSVIKYIASISLTFGLIVTPNLVEAKDYSEGKVLLARVKPGDLLNLGVDNISQGNYTQAISNFTTFINSRSNPLKLVYGYMNRGIAYQKLGTYYKNLDRNEDAANSYNKAIADYQKTIELDCCSSAAVRAYLNRGVLYYERGNPGDYQLANSDFNQIIVLLEEQIGTRQSQTQFGSEFIGLDVAYVLIGDVRQALGNREDAISKYTKAIELNDTNITAYLNRGYVYSQQQNYDKAISDFDRVIELKQILEEQLFSTKGLNLSKAEKESELQKLNIKAAIAYQNRGGVRLKQNLLDEAILDFQEAVKLDNENGDYHYNLGLAYYQKGFNDSDALGQESFRRAAQIYMDNGESDKCQKVEEQLREKVCKI